MSINRYFVNAIVIFIILFLTACGSKPDNQSQFPNSTSTITASPDYWSEIGSYQVVFSIKSLEHSSQEEITTKLFNLYLEHFKSEAVDIRIRLQDFKIQEVTIPPEFQYCAKGLGMEFIPNVKFSILPLRTPAPDWDAGSGISGNNNWIIDKIAYIGIFITKDSYSFRLLGVPPCVSSLVKPTIGVTPSIKVSPTPTSVPTYPIGQLPTVKVEEDWITYKNDIAEYEITIPHDANIKGELLQGVSEGYKLPEGMTFEEFIKQRDQKYGDRLCVGIAYKNGFVEIESFKVKDLGDHCLFGSLAGEQQYPISETITIKGIIYEAKGSRVEGKTGAYEESLRFSLSDDTLIVFGSITNDPLEYQQYLKNVRKTILNIIESYTVVN